MDKVKRTVTMKARIKDCDVVFDPDLGPGVIASQDLEFNETEDTYNSNLFYAYIMRTVEEFLNENVEVVLEGTQDD